MEERVKINRKVKFFYGLGDLSANILLAAFSFYLLFFMVSIGGLKPALASLVFLVAKIWDAITDVWMGRISDNTKSKFGKRRVYMIFGAVPFGLMFILLWLCPFSVETSQFVKFVYYLMAYCLFNTTYTIVYVPYNALTANITDDYDQRSSLTTVRIVLANVGLILGAALFGLFAGDNTVFSDLFARAGCTRFEAIKNSYLLSSAIFGLLAGVTMLISGINVKERYTGNEEKNPYGMLKTLSQFIRMKEFRYTTAYYLTSMLGFDVLLALFMFYIQDSLGYAPDGVLSMIFVAIPLLVVMASSVVWDKLSAKYEKHRVYLFSVILTSVGLMIALFVPSFKGEMYQSASASMGELLSSGTSIILTLAVFTVGCGMSGIQILPYAAYPMLNENINMIYAVSVPEEAENAYMVFTYQGTDYAVTEYTVNGNGQYCFEFTNINPQCIGDSIPAVLHTELNGEAFTATVANYSVKQYCVNMLNNPRYNSDAKLVALLSDLLTYGAAAQQYTGYRTDNLITAGLDLAPSAFSVISGKTVSFDGTADAACDWTAAGLILGNNVTMRYAFFADNVDGLTVNVSINGREVTFEAEDFVSDGSGKYHIDFQGIEANEFDDAVTATFYRGGKSVGRMVSYTVNAYVCSTQNSNDANLRALVRALYNYGASAAAYSSAE